LSETAYGTIALGDLERIASAKKVAAKIIGAKYEQTLEDIMIDDAFAPNTKKFLEAIAAIRAN
jgi:hypothetical protein